MSNEQYSYEDFREYLFTDDGQKLFILVRDTAKYVINKYGAFSMGKLDQNLNLSGKVYATNWHIFACIDRMIELGELSEIKVTGGKTLAQDRIFISAEQMRRMT